jgi:hypothetical protein
VTSSCAAVLQVSEHPVFSEADWNDQAPKLLQEQGRNAYDMTMYRAAKTLAEKGEYVVQTVNVRE